MIDKATQEEDQEKPAKKKRKNAAKPNGKAIKHRKVITKCAHVEEHYYASGMCKNCYHSKGRNKMASKCEHHDRKLYARGVCKACYLREYHNRLKMEAEAAEQPSSLQKIQSSEKRQKLSDNNSALVK